MSSIHDTWREEFRPLIARAIAEAGITDPRRTRAALKAAYPFQWRRLCPGRIWADEVRRILAGDVPVEHRGQLDLFAGGEQ